MRIGWLSDTHLDFLGWAAADRFVASLADHRADAWMVTGDIAAAYTMIDYLQLFVTHLPVTTYFTLGNHDFYGSSIGEDGWGDARFGNALTTQVMLNDFYRIADLKNLKRPDLVRVLNRLGDEAAARLAFSECSMSTDRRRPAASSSHHR